jgi:cytochrome d ubiquinol oxidase subunit II
MNSVKWETPYRGLEAALNIHNLSLGIAVFFLARILAILYFMNNIESAEIITRGKKQLKINTIIFLVFFLFFVTRLLMMDGFAYNPLTKEVFLIKFKYLHNLVEIPLAAELFLAGVILVVTGIVLALFKNSTKGIWYSGTGTIFTVLSLFFIASFNNTAYYPSTFDLQNSLTIQNSSSSRYTLTVMSYVSLLVPFVAAYIYYVWKAMDTKKISSEEIEKSSDLY